MFRANELGRNESHLGPDIITVAKASKPSFPPSSVLRQQSAAVFLNQVQMVVQECPMPIRAPICTCPITPVASCQNKSGEGMADDLDVDFG